MSCTPCKIGWHSECEDAKPIAGTDGYFTCCCAIYPVLNPVKMENSFEHLNPASPRYQKPDEDIQDQTSTGRKRAALLYPIPSVESGGMTCEWSELAFAGGGAIPIIGCRGNLIADIKAKTGEFWPGNVHHGPDKSTLNNEPDNVSRVCPTCHNRWHALNDPLYAPKKSRPDAGLPYLPLSGEFKPLDKETKATEAELDWSEKYWSTPTRQREGLVYRLPGLRD